MSAEALSGLVQSVNDSMRTMLEMQHQGHQDVMRQHAMSHQNLIERLSQPKTILRDENGKISGVR
jgi:hypothetical protein